MSNFLTRIYQNFVVKSKKVKRTRKPKKAAGKKTTQKAVNKCKKTMPKATKATKATKAKRTKTGGKKTKKVMRGGMLRDGLRSSSWPKHY